MTFATELYLNPLRRTPTTHGLPTLLSLWSPQPTVDRISYRLTLSYHTLRILPLLALSVCFQSHTLHEYKFNLVHSAYHTSGFSDTLPSGLPLFIITVRQR